MLVVQQQQARTRVGDAGVAAAQAANLWRDADPGAPETQELLAFTEY